MRVLKAGIVLLFVLSMVAFCLTFVVFSRRENEREKRLEAEQKIELLTGENDRLNEAFKDLTATKEQLDRELDAEKRRARELEGQVLSEREASTQLQTQMGQKDNELAALRQDAARAEKDFFDLNKRFKELAEKFSSVEKEKKRLEEQAAAQPVELPAVVVSPEAALAGDVLVVNRDFEFIVTNVGSADGLNYGDPLAVKRGEEEVGRVVVEKLYDKMAACTIVEEFAPLAIEEGDRIGPLAAG